MPGSRPLPFSEAVQVGDMLYLSGQLGTDSSGRLVPGGIGPETKQTLTNIANVLERHGVIAGSGGQVHRHAGGHPGVGRDE